MFITVQHFIDFLSPKFTDIWHQVMCKQGGDNDLWEKREGMQQAIDLGLTSMEITSRGQYRPISANIDAKTCVSFLDFIANRKHIKIPHCSSA